MVASNLKKVSENMVRKKPSARMTRLLKTLRELRNNSKPNPSHKLKQDKESSYLKNHPYDISKFTEKLLASYTGNNKPAELYRADLISAMKVPDSEYFHKEDFYTLNDPWRGEWDKGVQVPVNFIQDLNKPFIKPIDYLDILYSNTKDFASKGMIGNTQLLSHVKLENKSQYDNFDSKVKDNQKDLKLKSYNDKFTTYYHPYDMRKFEKSKINPASSNYGISQHQYNADAMDLIWLKIVNDLILQKINNINKKDTPYLTLKLFEGIMLELEKSCYNNIKDAFFKEKEVALEYDENVICDVCRSPDSEDTNEMVFCDICNICVHQACYGILKIPKGSWLCNPCSVGISRPKCLLCPNTGGAMKPTKSGLRWCHVSCALWIPEIGIADPDRMEPITKISQVPPERWSLICVVCREKHEGACIQCSVKSCRIAFHVTCGFKGGLDMKADWNHDDPASKHRRIYQHESSLYGSHHHPDVKLKAYCPKHSRKKGVNGTPQKNYDPSPTSVLLNSSVNLQASSNVEESRFEKLKQMEAGFYTFVDPKQEINKLLLPIHTLPFYDKDCFYQNAPPAAPSSRDLEEGGSKGHHPHPSWVRKAFALTHNYWKLKRRQRFNVPLVNTLAPNDSASLASSLFATYGSVMGAGGGGLGISDPDEAYSSASQQLESNLYHRLKMCVQLRQDLERVRNLSYMLIRREKLASSYVSARSAVFNKQVQLLSGLTEKELTNNGRTNALVQTVYQAGRDDSLYDQIVKLRLPPMYYNSPFTILVSPPDYYSHQPLPGQINFGSLTAPYVVDDNFGNDINDADNSYGTNPLWDSLQLDMFPPQAIDDMLGTSSPAALTAAPKYRTQNMGRGPVEQFRTPFRRNRPEDLTVPKRGRGSRGMGRGTRGLSLKPLRFGRKQFGIRSCSSRRRRGRPAAGFRAATREGGPGQPSHEVIPSRSPPYESLEALSPTARSVYPPLHDPLYEAKVDDGLSMANKFSNPRLNLPSSSPPSTAKSLSSSPVKPPRIIGTGVLRNHNVNSKNPKTLLPYTRNGMCKSLSPARHHNDPSVGLKPFCPSSVTKMGPRWPITNYQNN